MEITVSKSELARALQGVVKAVESRNTIPILGHVRLVSTGDRLQITATDLDIVATDVAWCEGTAGSACVDAKLFTAVVNKAGADLNISLKDGILVVKSGRSLFKLASLPADDFPDLPAAKFDAEFDIDLAQLFAPVSFAISTEETRYYLNGIFFRGGANAVAVATDGHRLARNNAGDLPDFAGVIVPRKTVSLLPKGTVSVAVSDSRIRVAKGDFVILSKLIDGTFPDYERVIPKDNDKAIGFDGDDMRSAASRVAVVSSERGRAVRLNFAGGAVKLEVNSAEFGSAVDEIQVDYSGEPIEIGFNSAYLSELVGIFPPGDIMLALSGGGSPAVFTSAAAEGLLCVLMPCRV